MRVIVFPTKGDGRCWDVCEKSTQESMAALTEKMRAEQRKAVAGPLGFDVPTPETIEEYFNVGRRILIATGDAAHLPEIAVRLDSRVGPPVDFRYTASDSLVSFFSRQRNHRTGRDEFESLWLTKKHRTIVVTISDVDFLSDDPVGQHLIEVPDRIFEKGGTLHATFDQVYSLQIVLSRP